MTATDPMHNVPTIFDSGHIDNHGHWRGQDMSCLERRESIAMQAGITSTYRPGLVASAVNAARASVNTGYDRPRTRKMVGRNEWKIQAYQAMVLDPSE